MKTNTISINIWDDYYDDGFIPEGKIQETYAYIESKTNDSEAQGVLSLLKEKIEQLMNSMLEFEMNMYYYESSKEFPSLVGSEYEHLLYQRWQLGFKHLTHRRCEWLVDELNDLQLKYNGKTIEVYSES
jgi:hypothetical protein